LPIADVSSLAIEKGEPLSHSVGIPEVKCIYDREDPYELLGSAPVGVVLVRTTVDTQWVWVTPGELAHAILL